MSRKYVFYRGAVAFFALCFVFSVLFAVFTGMQNVRAAEEDTATVSGVSVEWDGNGNNHDLVTLTLNGASFASNTDSNSHWEYFAPYIYVNGTAVTGNVAWAIEGRYTATSNFCFYLNQNILKQDGSDLIEVREGCKIPLGDGADYYVVSETASFVAPVNAQNTGTETFVKGSAVTVSGVSVEWDGNGGGNDLVILTLEGAAFESNLTSNTHRHEIESHIFVNGTAISGVAWAIEGRYTNPKHYCFYLPQDMLKQDGTDVIEVRRGCHIPHNDGESYYLVTENAVYLSSGSSVSGQTETFAKQFIWETGKKYDINADVLKAASAGNIGEYETKGVTLSGGHESWGLTGGDAYTQGLAIGDYAVFEFTKAVETSLAKSLTAEVKYDAKALFYVYPLGTQALTYENAVQSFRTSGSGINAVTISLESLAKEGSCGGFILQLIDGDSLQFFLDSMTLSADSFTPGEPEKPEEPAQPAKKADVAVTGVQVVWHSASSNWIYLTLDKATFAANEDLNDQFDYFMPYISINGTLLSENAGSVVMARKGHYGEPTRFMIEVKAGESYSLKNDGNDVIAVAQGCRFPIEGQGSIDYYEVAEEVSFRSVSGGNHATDDTPETFAEQAKPIEWAAQKYDADAEIFMDTAAQTDVLGGYDSQRVLPSYFGDEGHAGLGLTDYAAYTVNALSAQQFAVFRLTTPIDTSQFKSLIVEYKYNEAKTLFYAYPLHTENLGYETAKQSFRTAGGNTSVTLSAEALAEPDGMLEGFILWLADGTGAQFFLDSITLSAESFDPGEVEEVVKFEWTLNTKIDIDASVIESNGAGNIGEYETKGVTLGSGHESWGLTGGDAYTQGLAIGDYAAFRFVMPIQTEQAKSVEIEYKYDGKALIYVYPLGAQELTYENALQSFWTTAENDIEKVKLSAEALGADGSFGGFILQLADGAGVQFFLDSITLSADSFDPGEVEEVVKFEWTLNTKIDIDASVLKTNGAGSIGEYETEGIALGSGHSDWGLTGDGFANTQILAKGDYFVVEFVLPIENTSVKSFSLEIMNNASACFYVYPLGTSELGYDSAVQSFRTSNGLSTVELSAAELFKDGACGGFIVQAMTDSGVQFFLDSITLSEKAVQAEVEDLTEPEYAKATVSIVEVSYTYRYEGGYDDLLLITFDQNIFNKTSDKGLNNERVELDDFAEFLLINGVSVSESGIGDYALRSMWERHDRLGIFIRSGSAGSLNNDAFDKITFAKGFAIRGSTGDYTMYTLAQDAVFYTNRALESGTQVTMSAESDPQVDQNLTPLLVTWKVSGGTATISITFDKTVRMEGSDFTENILRYIQVDGKALSEWGSEVTVTFDAMTIGLSFATTLAADADVRITIEKGMNVQTNPDEALSLKTVQTTADFVRGENKENYFFAQGGTLNVYWVTPPEAIAAENEEDTGFVTLDLRLSVMNAVFENFNSSVLKNILIGDDDLLKILTDESGASATLSGYTLSIKIPASYIAKGLVITVKKGFTTPAGGELAADESFFYDEIFEEFNGEVHREEIESILKLTDVNTILTATDGVAPGTNQLFIEFTTPCSTKYLPFMQADAETIFASYGSVGVTMPALYVYELNRYGMRESLWDYFLIDGKTLREWAVADGGADATRYIDVYYQGTNFGVYYLQLVINAQSSAVMDWSESHTITFKEGFITPAFGVFDKDVQFAWDPETKTWAPDASANATVDPNAQLKDETGEVMVTFGGGCSGFAAGTGTIFGALLVAGAVAALAVRKKRGANGTETGKRGE